ncbi:SAM-dependent methyltransferase [Oscillochloris sp. ZM17-4]|uniref:HsdM family class I SAM-dependent methyltransferase n=1 Tax=Oscillochloris sp. ZM17-4 TaxID=2866714 RepID=UPI001C73B022|nr:N-6 DNA methylase [Oscillochloris sp. ZM17-4]MBX0328584.1 SAM-dependent methyltransferase [Oscillochloris sp. ZM17-4]
MKATKMLSRATPGGPVLHFTPLPENAHQAVYDSLVERGFAREAILDSYNFTSRDGDFRLNVLAFADRTRRTPAEYSGCAVYNATNGVPDQQLIATLAQTAAPFHIIHRHDRFSFWASASDGKSIEPIALGSDIPYSNLSQALYEYKADFAPEQIVEVKQGRSQFTHPHLKKFAPLQLALWAIGVTRDTLVEMFGQAVAQLRADMANMPGIADQTITGLAIRMLGATILADTGVLGESVREQGLALSLNQLLSIAINRFPRYFHAADFSAIDYTILERAYNILRQVYYSGFVPEMLSNLYTAAYGKEQRKELGFYDTPLYLTRRILQNIPIEYLPPEQRTIVDMGCGWGSFLIAGVERLAQLSDMRGRSPREHIIGNDIHAFTAQLAGLGLLLSTSEDSWHIDHHGVFTWPWIETHQPGVIIGNPPFRGRRDQPKTLDELMPGEGRTRVEAANAHLDLAVRRVQPGGYIAMIMPRSFLASEAAPTVRHRLLENCDITEIWQLPGKVFPDATVQPIVLFARKNAEKQKVAFSVRTRDIQNSTLDAFKKSEVFTASNIVSNQSRWNIETRSTSASKNAHLIAPSVILSRSAWDMLRQKCDNLQSLSVIFPGTIRGKKEQNKRWLQHTSNRNVLWLTNAPHVVPRAWYINYEAAINVVYPRDFEEPRLENRNILDSQKTIMIASPNPSWGRRAKSVVERKGCHVSHSFWVISPLAQVSADFTNEVLSAILNWYVSNAWVAENRSYPWIGRRIIETIPIPRNLDTKDYNDLTNAVRQLELAAGDDKILPDSAQKTIDSILRTAYDLDDATYARLRAVAEWDEHPQITLDPQPDRSTADYIISGIVESVQAEQGTITLWMSGFDDLQTVPIDPLMPGWLLRPEAAFRAKIPFINKRRRTLEHVIWGSFTPQQYTYRSETELVQELGSIFNSDGDDAE